MFGKINKLDSIGVEEAKIINDKCVSRKSSWVVEAKKLGVSDRGLQKHCKKLLGEENYKTIKAQGEDIVVNCAFCGIEFTRNSYHFNQGWSRDRVFCCPEHQKEYEKKYSTKSPTSPVYLQELIKTNSLRGVALMLDIDKNTLSRRLHKLGILEASESTIKRGGLKPFVAKKY